MSADKQQNTPLIDDSMNEIFAPGAGTFIPEEEPIPEELQTLLELHNLTDIPYNCLLKRRKGNRVEHVKTFDNCFPKEHIVGKTFGPGDYELHFIWKAPDPNIPNSRKKVNHTKKINYFISSEYSHEHDEFKLERKLELAKKKREEIQKAKLDNELEGNTTGQNPDVLSQMKSYLSEFMTMTKELGLSGNTLQPQPAGKGIDLAELGKLLIPMIPAILTHIQSRSDQKRQEQQQFMTMLMTLNNRSTDQLVEVMKNNINPNPNKQMEDMFEMIKTSIDFKKVLDPEKESAVDKVFKAIEGVSPIIGSMLQMKAQERQQSMQYKMAQSFVANDPNFQEVAKDTEMLSALVARLDDHYGTKQTDEILAVGGMVRPNTGASAVREAESVEINDAEVQEPVETPAQEPVQASQEATEKPPQYNPVNPEDVLTRQDTGENQALADSLRRINPDQSTHPDFAE